MSGHVRQRGNKGQWYAVINVVEGGKRKRRWHRLENCSNEADAKIECARRIVQQADGTYVDPSKITVAEFVRGRIDRWEAMPPPNGISARTAQRYRELLDNQIAHIGNKRVQKLECPDIEGWHIDLHGAGLSARTIGHAHRLLGKALRDAERGNLVTKNVCKIQPAPRVAENEETEEDGETVVKDVPAFVAALRPSPRFYVLANIALFAGVRLSEVLALRWSRVDFDARVIRVREALEQTKKHGIRFKKPKSKAGRRDITLPAVLIEVLREHRRAALELRMQLGQGKLPDDALLFSDIEGNPLPPNSTSAQFGEIVDRFGLPDVTFHGLRHTHASQLIDAGVDIVTISKRLGHAKPDITLRVYAHLFKNDDRKAAAAIDAAFPVAKA